MIFEPLLPTACKDPSAATVHRPPNVSNPPNGIWAAGSAKLSPKTIWLSIPPYTSWFTSSRHAPVK